MTPERWRLITAIFHDALEREPSVRASFIQQALADDIEARAEVDRLLAAHEKAGEFGNPIGIGEAERTAASVQPSLDDANVQDSNIEPDSMSYARPDGRYWFTWLVLVVALAVGSAFAYSAILLMVNAGATKSLGWNERRSPEGWVVSQVDPAGPAAGLLQAGDRVISVNGVAPLRDAGTRVHRRQLAIGESYRASIDRMGQVIETTLMVSDGPRELATRITYFCVSLVWCGIGLFIGFARPEHSVARLAFASANGTGLVFLGGFLPTVNLVSPIHVVLGLHFFLRFPNGRPVKGFWKYALVLGYFVAAVPILLSWWFELTLLTGGVPAIAELVAAHGTLMALRGPAMVYFFYATLVGMVTAAAQSYRVLSTEEERRRVRWVIFGSILSFVPQVILSLAELIFGGVEANAWIGLPANAATIGIPLAVAYGVLKHRVFDIRVVIRLGVRYLLARRALQGAVAVPAIVLAYTAFTYRQLTLVEIFRETSGYLYFWLVAAALMLRFRQPIQSWLDRRFFREEYDRERLVLGLSEDMRKAGSLPELARLASDRLISTLHPSKAYVWYREQQGLVDPSQSDPLLMPPDVPTSGRWLAWLEQRGTATPLPHAIETGLSRQEARWFKSHGISLVVPMMDASDRLSGALLLGEKRSEEPYTDVDRYLLDAIARQVSDVHEILRLRARVSDEVRVRHDVLARLDSQLPDLLKECPACGSCFDGAAELCEHDGQTLKLSLPVARTIDGKYRLNRLIGKGGMGAVYEARDLRLDRTVAVKLMLSRAFGDQAALRRFRREARAAASLTHPNIVGVFDFGSLEGEGAYLVMELVGGRTLRAELHQLTRLSPVVVAEWFGPLLDGVAAAHSAGMIHRDLKPENVMGRRDDGGALLVKILDLGLVKFQAGASLATGTMTSTGLVMGTPAYMSPEQLLGREVDHRTDIFGLAVMVVESLTGRPPFQGDSFTDLLRAQQALYHLPGKSPSARALGDLLQQCLATNPADRVDSAAALRATLIPLLRDCLPQDLA